jgi:hypothetical protein
MCFYDSITVTVLHDFTRYQKKDVFIFYFQTTIVSKKAFDIILIVSGKQALNPEHEAMGAMKSAYQFSSLSKLQVIGETLFKQL